MSNEGDELYSLLVPLADERLIVPRACVAEVIRYAEPGSEPGSPNWMLGMIDWTGRQLPVVSFEAMLGKDLPAPSGRSRIVVFHAGNDQLKTAYFGVLTQGFPQLVRVNRDVLKLDSTEGWPEAAPVFCRVKMINEFPLIPDLDRLEAMLVDESVRA